MLGFGQALPLHGGVLLDHAEQMKRDRVGLRQPLGRGLAGGRRPGVAPRQMRASASSPDSSRTSRKQSHQEREVPLHLRRVEGLNRRQNHRISRRVEKATCADKQPVLRGRASNGTHARSARVFARSSSLRGTSLDAFGADILVGRRHRRFKIVAARSRWHVGMTDLADVRIDDSVPSATRSYKNVPTRQRGNGATAPIQRQF